MLMAISQFLGSTSTLFYIWMLHNSRSDTEYRAKSKPIMFISLMCDFEFLAYWVMAWNSLYTKLYSGASYATYLSSKRKCALPPSFYNLIFILFPIISISMDSYYLKLLLSSMSKHTNSWFDLLNDLKSSSITWEALMDPSISRAKHATLIGKFLSDANHSKDLTLVLLQNLNTVIRRFRHLCISWAIVLLITCIFFIYSLWSFLSLIYQSTKPKIPKSSDNIPGVNVTQNGSSCNTNFTEAEIPISPQKEMMKQKFSEFISARSL
ncbi:expressed protein [Phakopsora pachyrhizi]|uniref:Expressed protein n=1 Tax=Phakopsora pachyrhizi TaxID=170000 RepID=A0AAV0BBJ4_PHAPC|nr:expressed protein [Phakopsora pachyrhizi]